MPEHHPADDPGHLDIDAVSAFIDQDLAPAELASIQVHLRHCPACHREVLEIRTTVLLLSGLPQYTPRRSFRLGQEHARAGRRRPRGGPQPWLPPALTAGQTPTVAPAIGVARGAGWLAGMQAAAMIVGTLLLLVTVGDLSGVMPGEAPPMQLAAPTAAAALPTPTMLPLPQAAAPNAATDQSTVDGVAAPPPAALETARQQEPAAAGGTENDESASQQMLAANGPTQPRLAATRAAAAVTQAIPTPGATSGAAPESTARTAAPATDTGGRPSGIRLLQFALALLLAWLVVSIAGLRWVRRLR